MAFCSSSLFIPKAESSKRRKASSPMHQASICVVLYAAGVSTKLSRSNKWCDIGRNPTKQFLSRSLVACLRVPILAAGVHMAQTKVPHN